MIDTTAFSKMIPGFEFLQTLMSGAGAATPGIGQWVAPTLDPAELEKRIAELKTVQFWLEQNSRMLGATIQAMEVQRMTLSTLQTMNLPMAELHKAMLLPTAAPEQPAPAAPNPPDSPAKAGEAQSARPAAVDPMQWWSALTQQFGELAAKAVHDSGASMSTLAAALPAATAAAGKSSSTRTARRRTAASTAAGAAKSAKAAHRTPRKAG